ncbi:Protein CBG20121 [Caenorhabditis briggsae]|uniref:Uncharacterized protein n=2 Tax=Caenorhabditis briggsae TaxID=6238 RepID=A0AAE9EIS3_CAEBR|nr:Protein CBG20121 [Caenorhabditis briggsae]ULT99069.1 hypothetical protein L3Y34_000427 [Caenorhabditis briggsae]UMM21752.1 hypothetical protein L5515_003297 [Caenorhabditis briggsae]CAP37218.1 Protein CBG20121 [Caenorhabditis briggsae]
MKRAKSPSPERLQTGHSDVEPKFTDTTSSSDLYTDSQIAHRKKVARNESNTASTGSTASGRQSRSQQSDLTIPSSRALRRLFQFLVEDV